MEIRNQLSALQVLKARRHRRRSRNHLVYVKRWKQKDSLAVAAQVLNIWRSLCIVSIRVCPQCIFPFSCRLVTNVLSILSMLVCTLEIFE